MKNCIFGKHLIVGKPYIKKVPEGVVMCLECLSKHEDKKVYDYSNTGEGWYVGIRGDEESKG